MKAVRFSREQVIRKLQQDPNLVLTEIALGGTTPLLSQVMLETVLQEIAARHGATLRPGQIWPESTRVFDFGGVVRVMLLAGGSQLDLVYAYGEGTAKGSTIVLHTTEDALRLSEDLVRASRIFLDIQNALA